MRILVTGNAGEREPGQRYYNVERKLANGFLRNGHSVVFFSDRDVARAGTVFRSSRVGRGAAQEKFREAARNYAPHAIVLMHTSLIATETLAEAKGHARIAQVCVDPLFREVNVRFLADRARIVDATFVTTAGAALKRFSMAGNVCAYIPNPVDASVEDLRNFARDDLDYDVFFAANAGGDREDDARRVTPKMMKAAGLACAIHGFDGAPRLYGAAYFAGLGRARMGLNLNSDRAETATLQAPLEELYLYSSDRVSQLLGCGLGVLSFEVNRMMELFEPEREMVFAPTPEAMRDAALRLKRDDAARRRIAEAGWRKAHEDFNERLVAKFIEEVTFRRPLSQRYAWPTAMW
jgi:hypothetical protein